MYQIVFSIPANLFSGLVFSWLSLVTNLRFIAGNYMQKVAVAALVNCSVFRIIIRFVRVQNYNQICSGLLKIYCKCRNPIQKPSKLKGCTFHRLKYITIISIKFRECMSRYFCWCLSDL